jgi:hypothetical protein
LWVEKIEVQPTAKADCVFDASECWSVGRVGHGFP